MKSWRKNIYLYVGAIVISCISSTKAYAQQQETYFQYPQVPESLQTLQERSDFFIDHFWERCNLKSAFSSMPKMRQAFSDYTSFMPYASEEVVMQSIQRLVDEVGKQPKNLLTLAEIAEEMFYSDTARIACDACYLKFAKAVVNNKKISRAEKARFEYQAHSLEGSQVGLQAPDFTFTRPDGTTGKLSDIPYGAYVLLFFNDPDCDDCEMARIRLAADIAVNDLINSGKLVLLSIYPNDPNDEWIEKTATYPNNWIVGATPDADRIYDMRSTPTVYYLNDKHEILTKNLPVENLIEGFRAVMLKSKR